MGVREKGGGGGGGGEGSTQSSNYYMTQVDYIVAIVKQGVNPYNYNVHYIPSQLKLSLYNNIKGGSTQSTLCD